ncbi:ABC transporter substrate-binding protein [Acidianus sp. HS-5]|uniref:extracellular solute-binding protein n=1 Tax=Acidianus sp. HS-5 TaxID=2886040 RepID=UPI001F1D2D9D|nr:ABC transporter substrate-binding protein [Acidianus sp. HS-5]BDC18541.1 hypothetical protein HS5_14310 [Acidianus sp. HS-5]
MKGISKTIIALIVVVIVIIAGLAAYLAISHKTTTTSVTLTVVTFSGESAKFIQCAGNLFSKEHPGVTVKVICYPFSEYITEEISALEAHSTQYDIIGFSSTSAQKVSPYLICLNESMFNMTDIIMPQEDFGGIIYNTTTGKTEMIGIAYETAVYLTAYKECIFCNSTLAKEFYEEYHMNFNPTTWENWSVVLDVDSFLTTHGITKYGFLIDDHVSHGIIDAYPAVFGWYYRDCPMLTQGKIGGIPGYNIMFESYTLSGYSYPLPSFNSTAGVKALETYYDLISYEPSPSSVQICYGNFAQFYPEAAGAFIFTTQLTCLNTTERDHTYLAPLPGDYAETGTDFLGISKYSPNKQLAEEFLAFLVSPQTQKIAFLKFGKFPISKEAFQSLISNTSIPSYEREWLTQVYRGAEEAWSNPPNIPPTYPSLIPSFNNEVHCYLTGKISAEQALNTAAQDWIKAVSG